MQSQSQSQSQFFDMYRSVARTANDTLKSSLQTSQRIHQQQLQLVQNVLEQNSKAAKQLSEVQNMDDLLSTQSEIAGAQVAHVMETWRSLFRAMGDAQLMLMTQFQSQMGQASDTVRQAYDLTARATEEATRTAASQVTASNTSFAREAANPSERRPQQGEAQHRKSA